MFMADKMNLLDENTARSVTRMLMNDKNMTIGDLSKLSGVSRSTISHWLNGKSSITYANLVRITKILTAKEY